MERSEQLGLGIAATAHLALLAALSLTVVRPPAPPAPPPLAPSVDVSLVDEVGLVSSAPAPVADPAPSTAPEAGPPEDAPPPAPEPEAAPPEPAPKAAPPPKPVPAPRPDPRPQPARPPREPVAAARPAPAKPVARPARPPLPAPPALKPGEGRQASAEARRPRGSRLSPELVAGLVDKPGPSKVIAPTGAVIDAKALAGIVDAIRRQIQPCADRAVNPGPGANRIVTTLNLRLAPDGTLQSLPSVVRQSGIDDENDRYARRVIDLGIAAFKGCAPLKLPAEYYQTPNGGWYNINYNWQLR